MTSNDNPRIAQDGLPVSKMIQREIPTKDSGSSGKSDNGS